MFKKAKVSDVYIFNAFFDFADDLRDLFGQPTHEIEPEYDNFINCFDPGLSEKDINTKYEFDSLDDFEDISAFSTIGLGNINIS